MKAMRGKRDRKTLKAASSGTSLRIRVLKRMLLGLVLAGLFLGHGFGYDMWQVPPGQPVQMISRVQYNPKLTDPFFKVNEWSYWTGGQEPPEEGMFAEGEQRRLWHTARCFSNWSGGKHSVRFCEAKLLDANMIDLFIHDMTPAFDDRLRVQIRNGTFECRFWSLLVVHVEDWMWTTKRQKLTLHKRVYRKGDVIKGRIDFECAMERKNAKYVKEGDRNPPNIKVYGVFKTTLR